MVFEIIKNLILFTLAFLLALFLVAFYLYLNHRFNLKKVNIRDEKTAPIFYKFHQKKSETPTMGGVVIWGAVLILGFIFLIGHYLFGYFFGYFNFINRAETYLPLGAMFLAAIFGLIDDLMGIFRIGPRGGGMSMVKKVIIYLVIAIIGAWWFYFKLGFNSVHLPFIGDVYFGFWYVPFFIFILFANAFSANEADGLDGLLAGVMIFAFGSLMIVAFVLGKYYLAALSCVILGALLAFLWFNIYPARFFMGDTGSMALGITFGVMSLLTDTVFLLPFFLFIPLIESLSVIVQVISKKIFKRKIFFSTPIHHHFEAIGWPETKITMRFWIISIIFNALGLVIFLLDRFI